MHIIFKMKYKAIIFLMVSIFFSCRNEKPQIPFNKRPPDMTKENLLEMNRVLAELEKKNIAEYIAKTDTSFKQSSSTFWYKIENGGNGELLKRGDKVHIRFNLSLLDGSLCYTPDNKGDQTITIGRYDINRGLDEALLTLREGGRGKFIIPADLAFGIIGDQDCIGSKQTVIYDILSVEKNDF